MTDLTQLSVISTAESALKKLKKAQIPVFDCKKDGTEFIFTVKDKDIKKAFAIFEKPCYNIKVISASRRRRLLDTLRVRIGLIVGALLFVVLAMLSDAYVLKIEVSGSGSYLEPEVRRIVLSEGAREFGRFSSLNYAGATGRILSLPQVTFCNIQKRGSVLIVDVQVDGESGGRAGFGPLVADESGVIRNIVAVCGTPAVAVGDTVKKGDTLIYAYIGEEENVQECFAAGYAEIECSKVAEYFAAEESEDNLKDAYASLLLEADEFTDRSYKVKPTSDGVIYVIEFTYLHKVSINLS